MLSYTIGESPDLQFYMEGNEIISVDILSVHALWLVNSSNFPREIIRDIYANINILGCFIVLFMIARNYK